MTSFPPTRSAPAEHEVLAMERKALERWCNGDPSGFLEISAPDVVYFDPYREHRLDGLSALSRLYEDLRGKVFASRYEIVAPLVQQIGDAAVLTFRFISVTASGETLHWNCTEVYRRDPGRAIPWQIVQSHWSYTWPPPPQYIQAATAKS